MEPCDRSRRCADSPGAFVAELVERKLIGAFERQIAFPVSGGCHYRKKDGSWRYSLGAKCELFSLGEIDEGANVHVFESQWDALAFAHLTGEWNNIVATRGNQNAATLTRFKDYTGTLYLWPQNDRAHLPADKWPKVNEIPTPPAEKWMSDIRELLPNEQIKICRVPNEHKDLNDWLKAGAEPSDIHFTYTVQSETLPEELSRSQTVELPALPAPAQAEPVQSRPSEGGKDSGEARESAAVTDDPQEKSDSRDGDTFGDAGERRDGGHSPSSAPSISEDTLSLDLAKALDDTVDFLNRYVTFPAEEQSHAIALWIAHAHAYNAFRFTPYLHVCSPEKRCGKTRLLECTELLVPRPRAFVRPSEPVLFRTIEREKPTLLLDEVDTIFGGTGKRDKDASEGLRAVLNAGFQAGAKIPRCVGKDFDIQEFSVFCPKVIAGIGRIPDTVRDRSIEIKLVRQTSDLKASRFRLSQAQREATPIKAALENWAKRAVQALSQAQPQIPEQLTDRQQDMCEPLFAIAEMAGPDWESKGRESIISLSAVNEDQSVGVQLLGSIREIFAYKDADRVTSTALLESLISCESADAPWPGWWEADVKRGNLKAPAMKLARLLEPYGIKPRMFEKDELLNETARGYFADDFKDAWRRYLKPVKGMENMELAL
jgi:hypothetical protein